jgi:hypothetical protein
MKKVSAIQKGLLLFRLSVAEVKQRAEADQARMEVGRVAEQSVRRFMLSNRSIRSHNIGQ